MNAPEGCILAARERVGGEGEVVGMKPRSEGQADAATRQVVDHAPLLGDTDGSWRGTTTLPALIWMRSVIIARAAPVTEGLG